MSRTTINAKTSAMIRVLSKRGLSQREIAATLKISRSAVYDHIHKQLQIK